MQAVDDIGGHLNSAVIAEGNVRTPNVIVDGFGQVYDVQPLLPKEVGGLLSAVSAQDNQAVQLHLLIVGFHGRNLVDAVLIDDPDGFEGLAGGAQDGAALRQDAGEVRGLHQLILAEDKTLIAVLDAVYLHILAELLIEPLGNAAYSRVQSLAVAAACQNAYSFHSKSSFLL